MFTHGEINLAELLANAHHPNAGAVVLFSGNARLYNKDKKVDRLYFEAFEPLAAKMIDEILKTAIHIWQLQLAVCVHRLGEVAITECAVCVITASAHRKEAYTANQYIMHRLKHEVPIWKKETYADGTFEWGNNCNCANPYVHEPFENHLPLL